VSCALGVRDHDDTLGCGVCVFYMQMQAPPPGVEPKAYVLWDLENFQDPIRWNVNDAKRFVDNSRAWLASQFPDVAVSRVQKVRQLTVYILRSPSYLEALAMHGQARD
jgi:hypothetical protein